MENIIGPRLKQFRDTQGLTQEEFGEACGISQRTYANLENGRTRKVSAEYLNQIEARFPLLSPKWLRAGVGPMLREAAPAGPSATAAEEPAAPYATVAPAGVVDKMLAHISELGQRHSEDLKAAKKDYNRRVIAQATLWQNTVDVMERQREELKAQVLELKQEIWDLKGQLGQRPLTPAEQEAEARQAPREEKRPTVKGLRSYEPTEQPQGVEVEMAVSYSNPAFTRPLPLEQETRHLQAA